MSRPECSDPNRYNGIQRALWGSGDALIVSETRVPCIFEAQHLRGSKSTGAGFGNAILAQALHTKYSDPSDSKSVGFSGADLA